MRQNPDHMITECLRYTKALCACLFDRNSKQLVESYTWEKLPSVASPNTRVFDYPFGGHTNVFKICLRQQNAASCSSSHTTRKQICT